MSYRNRTYIIFDGDNDMWAYAYMKGWKTNDQIDFNFYDAHDLRTLPTELPKIASRRRCGSAWPTQSRSSCL